MIGVIHTIKVARNSSACAGDTHSLFRILNQRIYSFILTLNQLIKSYTVTFLFLLVNKLFTATFECSSYLLRDGFSKLEFRNNDSHIIWN